MPAILERHGKLIGAQPLLTSGRRSRSTPDSAALDDVYAMLEKELGIDFKHYKPSTVTRRIERRLSLTKVEDVQEYVARLQGERGELDVLYRDLLIGVTRFFRNEPAFELLETRVLPDLLDKCIPGRPLQELTADSCDRPRGPAH